MNISNLQRAKELAEQLPNLDKARKALADFNPRVVGIRDKPYQNTVVRMKRERDSRPKATAVEMHPKTSE